MLSLTLTSICLAYALLCLLLCLPFHLIELHSRNKLMRHIRNTHSVARMLAASLPHVAAKPLR